MEGMDSSTDRELGRLDRQNRWMWVLTAFLLMALAATVVALYLPGFMGLPISLLPAPESRAPVSAGICGLTFLFCLYMFLRQRQIRSLTKQLFEARAHEDTLRSRIFELSTLFDVAGEAHLKMEFEPLLETVTRRVLTCMEADHASILLAEHDQKLRCRASSGGEIDPSIAHQAKVGEGVAGWVAQSNEPLVLSDDEALRRLASEIGARNEIATAMCAPLSTGGRAIGVINVARTTRERPFSAGDARLLSTFGHHVAAAIHRLEDSAEIGR